MRKAVLVVLVVALAAACGTGVAGDFDQDAATDRIWVDRLSSTWYRATAGGGTEVVRAGTGPFEDPVPADYDGDDREDPAVLLPDDVWATGSAAGTISFPRPPKLVADTQIAPVPGDYDGDGADEPAWFRDTDAAWFILGQDPIMMGADHTTIPGGPTGPDRFSQEFAAPADYDGDRITDAATWNWVSGAYRVRSSRDGTTSTTTFDAAGATVPLPVPADYDGVGHAVPAVFDQVRGWRISGHSTPDLFGTADPADVYPVFPTPADHDGDRKADLSVFTGIDGDWLVEGQDTVHLPVDPSFADRLPLTFTVTNVYGVARSTYLTRCLNRGSC